MSIAIGGLSYLGVGTFTEQPGAEIETDYYGIDTLTRQYDVRPDSVAAFRFANPKGRQDTQFPWMYVNSLRITDVSGVMGRATVVYKGAQIQTNQNANLPRKEMIKCGLVTQQTTLADLLDLENGSGREITYRAPWSEWRYISVTDPKVIGPLHAGQIIQNDKTAKVLWARGTFGKTIIVNDRIIPPGETPSTPTLAQFVGLLKVIGSKFDVEQVGNVYTVLERNELIVVDYQMFLYNNATGW